VSWAFLALAIVAELGATLSLRASVGLRDRRWTPAVIGGYVLSFSLRAHMPVAVAYAIWTAVGVVATALASRVLFGDPISRRMASGILLIVVGVLLVQVGSSG
jgi:small multidrug resistance pump